MMQVKDSRFEYLRKAFLGEFKGYLTIGEMHEFAAGAEERIADLERQLAEERKRRGSLELIAQNAHLRICQARLREALKFYADPESYDEEEAPGTFVCGGADTVDEWERDGGNIARAAFADSGGEEPPNA